MDDNFIVLKTFFIEIILIDWTIFFENQNRI